MSDVVDDLKTLLLLRTGSEQMFDPEVREIFSRAIGEIESLRVLTGIPGENALTPIGAVPRSPHWPKVRAKKLELQPECEATGTTEGLEVHHVNPFHEHPELELDLDNLIVLARPPHFLIGHLCSWQSHNPEVRKDAATLRKKIKNRP